MKKIMCFSVMFCICSSLFAFDRSIIGSWGIIEPSSEKSEMVRFGQNEIIVFDDLSFRSSEFERTTDDTIFIEDFDGDSVLIQYYLLSRNKLLFIIIWLDNPDVSLTLILSKL